MLLLKRFILLLAVIVLLSSSGCAKNIGATYDPFFMFPATAQWSWNEALNTIPDDPSMAALNIRTLIRETITEGLAKHGYVMASKGGKVDFQVNYHVGIGKRVSANSVEGFGSLALTLVDVSTNRDVWQGFVKTEVDVSIPEAERRARLQKEIDTMLKRFPPSQPR